ncbi:hypothetical protein GH714_011836 [Hevea brasiliensis]|uniref:Uncharacterized protein n=1 Tax=Hevea brasiliensis TaxID=3981 RepID=A0A6A6N2P7_HEVBR|nr:hypothetical protein GH714_011836 [Hevea brasiliensis]
MAEAVVSVAAQKISDLLIQESVFLHGVRDEVQRLQSELKRMQCFLKDADRNQDQDDRVRNWVAEVRDLTYDAEDVIDTFLLKVARRRGEGVRGFINRASFKFTKAFLLHETGTQIKSIQAKIEDKSKSMKTYSVKLDVGEASNRQQESRRSYPNAKEEYVISLDAVVSDLKAGLMTEEERMRVVSIVGMGGLGKTTLAKKVYNDAHVKQHFDCYSWVFVSQQFSIKDVLVGILINVASGEDKSKLMERMKDEQPLKSMLEKMKEEVQFKSVLESLKEERLIEALHSVLEEKRYLVVFDDIWTNEAWDCLKPAFLKGKKGSKVLFTTRHRTLASHADPWSSPVEPPFLTDDEGWELLERKTFPREIPKEHGCTPELEKLGREMVKKCRGLPLAVVVLGGLLATKKSLKEWEVVHGSINAQFVKWEQDHQYGGVYGILALSYHDLPFHLKPCFLYLSQFPEDWEFEKNELIRMWIDEGFILQSSIGGEETMEDVGEEYLEELCVDAKDLIKTDAIRKLTNLRNLSVDFWAKEEVEVVLRSPIFKLGRLRSLRMLMEMGSFPNLEPLSSLRHLTRVKLCGTIPEDPHSLHHNLEHLPASLAKLTLEYSQLKKRDPMGILEKLPNLIILELDIGSYKGSKIVCSAHGFPQLETHTLASLKALEEWEIDEGAMPCLKTLRLLYLQKLKMIPEGMKSVTTIQELKICGMREGFEERVKVIDAVKGEDFEKVHHIPSILFHKWRSWKNKNHKGIPCLFFLLG